MSQEIFIQVRFKELTEFGEYNDALYFTLEEYELIDQTFIDQLKQDRIDAFIFINENPPILPDITKDELLLQIADLESTKILCDEQIIKHQDKIAEIELDKSIPSTPKNFKLEFNSETQVDFSWEPSSDNEKVIGYRIFRDDKEIRKVFIPFYSDVNLKPGTTYKYNVLAFDAGNSSLLSEDFFFTTLNKIVGLNIQSLKVNKLKEK